jgi:uncharacterized protein YegP (UPF0339 family)
VAGKFELYADKAGKFRFRLKAGNGEIIAVSEAYETKASASNGIESCAEMQPTRPSTTRPPPENCAAPGWVTNLGRAYRRSGRGSHVAA